MNPLSGNLNLQELAQDLRDIGSGGLGTLVVPVTIIDGQAIKGFGETALRKALGASES